MFGHGGRPRFSQASLTWRQTREVVTLSPPAISPSITYLAADLRGGNSESSLPAEDRCPKEGRDKTIGTTLSLISSFCTLILSPSPPPSGHLPSAGREDFGIDLPTITTILYAPDFVLQTSCSMLRAPCFMLHAPDFVLHVPYRMFHASCSIFHSSQTAYLLRFSPPKSPFRGEKSSAWGFSYFRWFSLRLVMPMNKGFRTRNSFRGQAAGRAKTHEIN
jgi:hypothetical protein